MTGTWPIGAASGPAHSPEGLTAERGRHVIEQFLALSPAQRHELLGAQAGRCVPVVPRVGSPAVLPASYGQEAQWFLWRCAESSSAYNVPACYDVTGPLRPSRLRTALRTLGRRHEILRTTYGDTDAGVVQYVHDSLPLDVAMAIAADREQAVDRAIQAAVAPFDLRREAPMRVRLFRYAPERHLLLISAHHIAVDDHSSNIIERDLGACYRAAVIGGVPDLPPLTVQYADFAAWHRCTDWQPGLGYWRHQLADARPSELAGDRTWPDAARLLAVTRELEIGPTERAALGRLSASQNVSRFVVLCAMLALLLAEDTFQRDITFGTPITIRPDRATSALIGFFLNTAVLRLRIDGQTRVSDLIAEARRVVGAAFDHQYVPFRQVVEAVSAHGDGLRNPLFNVMFIYLPYVEGPSRDKTAWLADDLRAESVPLPTDVAYPFVSIAFVEKANGASLVCRYPRDVYTRTTMESWGYRLRRILRRSGDDPGALVTDIIGSPA
jgi:hypothetical protein